jgi:hypothetical protein
MVFSTLHYILSGGDGVDKPTPLSGGGSFGKITETKCVMDYHAIPNQYVCQTTTTDFDTLPTIDDREFLLIPTATAAAPPQMDEEEEELQTPVIPEEVFEELYNNVNHINNISDISQPQRKKLSKATRKHKPKKTQNHPRRTKKQHSNSAKNVHDS